MIDRLYAVGDISCDVNGSIEFLEKTTSIDKPFFSWNPTTKEVSDEISNDGIAVMGVDILPTEIAVESSNHFGEALMPLLKQLISNGFSKDDDIYEKLPPELVSFLDTRINIIGYNCSCHQYSFSSRVQANACITQNGALTPNFQYIEALMSRASAAAVHHSVAESHLLLRITVSCC